MTAPQAAPAFETLMTAGAAAHAEGRLVDALSAFQSAHGLKPHNDNAASACAAVLFDLQRPQAALRMLHGVEAQLLRSPEGCRNLAMAWMAVGNRGESLRHADLALALAPDHLPSLALRVQIASCEMRWSDALRDARRCVELAPGSIWPWTALIDLLCSSRQPDQALVSARAASQRFPSDESIAWRLAWTLTLNAEFAAASVRLQAIGAGGTAGFFRFLTEWSGGGLQLASEESTHLTDRLMDLYCQWVLDGLTQCDWRDHARNLALIRQQIQSGQITFGPASLLGLLRHGRTLGLTDLGMSALSQALRVSGAMPTQSLPAFEAKEPPKPGTPLRIGLLVPSLRDAHFVSALSAQLALHDHDRFAFFIYAQTPEPQAVFSAALGNHRVVEAAHFTDEELTLRIRLDRLDVWIDLCTGSPWWRPAVASHRVAPVQLTIAKDAVATKHLFDYRLTDIFTEPERRETDPVDTADSGPAAVRLPRAGWNVWPQARLDEVMADDDAPARESGDPVFCAWTAPETVDAESLNLWMRILAAVPSAVLWLLAPEKAVMLNLQREAHARGIAPDRLRFFPLLPRALHLQRLRHADIFLDPLRVSSSTVLVDALSLGIPSISCVGAHAVARHGAGLLHSLGVDGQVVDSHEAYVEAAVRLARDNSLRDRLKGEMATLNRLVLPVLRQSATREMEAAWMAIVERQRAGQAPATINIPPSL
ncbi:tetratricopeptide repeat protein [Polaromonas sp. YR568]|uniref:O-linked N-acetylglucosamine transferase family protein n=1 Tax=Polaromonas sp. YR568 TaxID=1855301 RepID=UPI003137BCF6